MSAAPEAARLTDRASCVSSCRDTSSSLTEVPRVPAASPTGMKNIKTPRNGGIHLTAVGKIQKKQQPNQSKPNQTTSTVHEGRKGREKAIVLLINRSQFGSKPALFVHLVRTDRAAFPGGPARGHALAGEVLGRAAGGPGSGPGSGVCLAAPAAPSGSHLPLTPVPAGTSSAVSL